MSSIFIEDSPLVLNFNSKINSNLIHKLLLAVEWKNGAQNYLTTIIVSFLFGNVQLQ